MKSFFLLLCVLIVYPLVADRITVHNTTDQDLYAAIYYRKDPVVQRAGDIKAIERAASANMSRPIRKLGYDRQLVFSITQDTLAPELSLKDFDRLHSLNIGTFKGDVFYIAYNSQELLTGYTTIDWNLLMPAIANAKAKVSELQQSLLNQLPAIATNPYKSTVAHVRVGNELASGERDCIAKRSVVVRNALQRIAPAWNNQNKVPVIALVCSGGGYRAMLATLGVLVGLDKIGLLDCLTYVVGLSGSTWAIGNWMSSDKDIESLRNWIVNNIHYGLKRINNNDALLIAQSVVTKILFNQPIGFVDLYGALLANELFSYKGSKKQLVHLSEQTERIKQGAVPFPIYTAIRGDTRVTEHQWYEFTPFEVGAWWLERYIPSWSYGRKFNNHGSSIDFAPEQSFGTLMATYGLAVGVTVGRIMQEINLPERITTSFMRDIVNQIMASNFGDIRFIAAKVFNYALDVPVMHNERFMRLVDAGINFNLPYDPISGLRSERKADIIIFVDASDDPISKELKLVDAYARSHKLKLPRIVMDDVRTKSLSIFKDDTDPEVPLVMYMPSVVDAQLFALAAQSPLAGYATALQNFNVQECIRTAACNTFNFAYSHEDANRLATLLEFNVLANARALADAIRWKLGTS